ncbi:MAG: winged helix-turn-helix domain-containing protein [Endomicrobiia bacterium]
MNIEEIGTNAGKIWMYLSNKTGFVSILELKFNLKLSNTQLYLSLGWLAREDKIIFTIEGNELKVKLK